jgi:malonyl CoA-acyl carrier protein transacylase
MTTVDRSDLEAKLREIEGVVTETEEEVRSRGRLIIAGVAVVAVVLVGYAVWRMRRKPIQVEVYYSS